MNRLNLWVLLAVFSLLLAACATQNTTIIGANASSLGLSEGRVVVSITDAAADMGAVSEVHVTIDAVRVHSTTQGWVTVSEQSQTYDLLELKAEGEKALFASAELEAGTYGQMELEISEVIIVDDEGEHEAKLPSGSLRMNGELEIKANSTSTATFDFIADESLHMTGNGEYIMAPVVEVETRSDANVAINSDNSVDITGGSVDTRMKVGMDAKGNVDVGLTIPANVNISLGSGGVISIGNTIGIGSRNSTRLPGSAKSKGNLTIIV